MIIKIGKKLTELRNKKHLTQQQMAELLGIKRERYSAWENDISQPRIGMLQEIAKIHKVPPSFLLGDDSNNINGDLPKPQEKELDENYHKIERFAKRLSPRDLKKAVKILDAAFEDAFNEDDYEDKDDI